MTTSNTLFYSLNDFNNILFDDFQYKLSTDVCDIVKELATKLGVTTEKEKEKEKKRDYQKSRNYRNSILNTNDARTEESWAQLRSFKTTVVEKKTEGVEKTMNDIRSCLNKISTKNYESKKNEIIEYINSLFLDETEELSCDERLHNKEIEKIANNIFEIASTNKFFSELYAQLYKSLIERFQIFKDILTDFIANFTDTMYKIDYVSPNDDYDKFCEYNKQNDIRKATSVFIVNLVKKEVLEPEFLLNICIKTLSIVSEYVNQENRVNEVEEITENIFLLVSQSNDSLKELDEWDGVIQSVRTLSQMKAKDKPSLSSRSIFKYMDIMDKIKSTN